ncbi:hypothetical protein [Streptomyces sp. SudanB148_2056]|uniref:hypothetical protein n=1 Tax=Streptomyces sp. SudanB148_2056 TaxID=3035280 RepID=UPI003636B93D
MEAPVRGVGRVRVGVQQTPVLHVGPPVQVVVHEGGGELGGPVRAGSSRSIRRSRPLVRPERSLDTDPEQILPRFVAEGVEERAVLTTRAMYPSLPAEAGHPAEGREKE